MSAERYIYFRDLIWFKRNQNLIINEIRSLDTFFKEEENGNIIYLSGKNKVEGDWEFDIRFFFEETYIFFEILSHGDEITRDLKKLFNWIRCQTEISIEDEDGVISNW